MNKYPILTIIGFIALVVLALVGFGVIKNPLTRMAAGGSRQNSDGTVTTDDTVKCEYQDANGNTITITGKGDEFERLCKAKRGDQAHYFTGYSQPYYPYRYWYYPVYGYQWYYYPNYFWGNRAVII